MRILQSIEVNQVAGAQTTLVEREDGLHVYMTKSDEQFEFKHLTFYPDKMPRYDGAGESSYHYEIFEYIKNGVGTFHARIWKV